LAFSGRADMRDADKELRGYVLQFLYEGLSTIGRFVCAGRMLGPLSHRIFWLEMSILED
jgi:hypothetical protein